MLQFTEKDIVAIKSKINHILYNAYNGYHTEFNKCVRANILDAEQSKLLITLIKKLGPSVDLEPLPRELHLIIDMAKFLIQEENKNNKFTSPINYEDYYSYGDRYPSYSGSWDDGY